MWFLLITNLASGLKITWPGPCENGWFCAFYDSHACEYGQYFRQNCEKMCGLCEGPEHQGHFEIGDDDHSHGWQFWRPIPKGLDPKIGKQAPKPIKQNQVLPRESLSDLDLSLLTADSLQEEESLGSAFHFFSVFCCIILCFLIFLLHRKWVRRKRKISLWKQTSYGSIDILQQK